MLVLGPLLKVEYDFFGLFLKFWRKKFHTILPKIKRGHWVTWADKIRALEPPISWQRKLKYMKNLKNYMLPDRHGNGKVFFDTLISLILHIRAMLSVCLGY
jgi:hypothetical protein